MACASGLGVRSSKGTTLSGVSPATPPLNIECSAGVCEEKTEGIVRMVKRGEEGKGEKASNSKKTILVTGGAGYIGSHTVLVLLQQGYDVVVVDNLSNSSQESLERVRVLAGLTSPATLSLSGHSAKSVKLSEEEEAEEEAKQKRLVFHNVDLCDAPALRKVIQEQAPEEGFDAVIHFAGLKAVGESVQLPLLYYHNNLVSTFNVLHELSKTPCKKFVFSSSATVYGTAPAPITEDTPAGQGITNPYGRTKFMIEEILRDFSKSPAGQDWAIESLRYFNPIGAHSSGQIGENPNGIPNNLMPYVSQVAVGKRESLTIFGKDYATADGTGVRDYIHVVDLAEGHLAALGFLEGKAGFFTHNLGTGKGYSVLDMVRAMETACGKPIKYSFGPRRAGDLATVFADPAKAEKELGWTAKRGLTEMVRDLWRWQSNNPDGYATKKDAKVGGLAPIR